MNLDNWAKQQAEISARQMQRSISATGLCKRREPFDQTIMPARGSVLASPEMAAWDPNPDYFFHWIRDSAIVMNAVMILAHERSAHWHKHIEEFVDFSLALTELDASDVHHRVTWPDYERYVRPKSELAALDADGLLGEPRFNPDGTIDVFRWSRPQYDGPALRALACLSYRHLAESSRTSVIDRLVRKDLDFTAAHAGHPCIGLWEEEYQIGHHYHTAVVQLGALYHGCSWAQSLGDRRRVECYEEAAQRLRAGLRAHWSAGDRGYLAIRDQQFEEPGDGLDAAAILAVLDARLPAGEHSVLDDKLHSTVVQIEDLFDAHFPINHERPPGHGPALGRARGDRYFGGGAWYPTTLALAEFYYRLASALKDSAAVPETPHNLSFRERVLADRADRDGRVRRCIAKGDAVLATVRRFTPPDGALSEQFDKATGVQTSARHLTWSYAALITAVHARNLAMGEPEVSLS